MDIQHLRIENISKIAMFTDIHFGCHNNSSEHSHDCMNFIDWFITQCKREKVDAVVFLGDWWENRNSISVQTLKYGIHCIRKLNQLNIPIFLIIGNHDLFHRHHRDIHSAEAFREFSNVVIIDNNALKINDELLILPFLFKDEYPEVVNEVNNSKYVFGHFEFRHFFITGTNTRHEHGYSHKLFDGPTHIFSGHFHKRQATENVIYIGNPFGTSYADAGDFDRGACILDVDSSDVDFLNYDGPSYVKTQLSLLLEGDVEIKKFARVRCLIDIDISYSEAQLLKKEYMEMYELREFILEENVIERQHALEESAIAELDELDQSTIDETIKKLIESGVQSTTTINPKKLIKIYGEL